MKLLVLLASLFVIGCSVEVSHQSDEENHDEESSTVERSRTSVGVGFLNEPTPPHEPNVQNAIQIRPAERSKTTVKVTRSPDRSIRVKGRGNTIVLGDLHFHLHVGVKSRLDNGVHQ